MTHWALSNYYRMKGSGNCRISWGERMTLGIPVASLWNYDINSDSALIDRRCLQRYVRREYLSIRRAINELRAK